MPDSIRAFFSHMRDGAKLAEANLCVAVSQIAKSNKVDPIEIS
jgi:hypothetical protein